MSEQNFTLCRPAKNIHLHANMAYEMTKPKFSWACAVGASKGPPLQLARAREGEPGVSSTEKPIPPQYEDVLPAEPKRKPMPPEYDDILPAREPQLLEYDDVLPTKPKRKPVPPEYAEVLPLSPQGKTTPHDEPCYEELV